MNQSTNPTIEQIIEISYSLEYDCEFPPDLILREWEEADPRPANFQYFVADWLHHWKNESLIPLEDGPHYFDI